MSRRRAGFFGALWDGFIAVHGPVVGIAGIGFALLAWKLGADNAVPLWVCAGILFIGAVICLSLCHALVAALRQLTGFQSLSVTRIVKPEGPFQNCMLVCLAETSTRPERGSSVLFLRYKEDVESQIGVGAVRWCQDDGRIQVSLDELYIAEADEFIASLKKGDNDSIKQLRIQIGHVPRVERFAAKKESKAITSDGGAREEAEQ